MKARPAQARAEVAIIHAELPWSEQPAGESPDAMLDDERVAPVWVLRGKEPQPACMGELTDGQAKLPLFARLYVP